MARRILIGTTNPSKIVWLKSYLADLSGIETVTLTDLGVTAPVSEEGRTPEENARIKALSYWPWWVTTPGCISRSFPWMIHGSPGFSSAG